METSKTSSSQMERVAGNCRLDGSIAHETRLAVPKSGIGVEALCECMTSATVTFARLESQVLDSWEAVLSLPAKCQSCRCSRQV